MVVSLVGFVLSFLEQERSTKSHENGHEKNLSYLFVDRLTWLEESLKIGHHPLDKSLYLIGLLGLNRD